MEKRQIKTGNWWLLLTALLPCIGGCLLAQKPLVSLTINDKTIAPNTPVTVTVTTNLNGTVKVDYPIEYAVDYGMMNGMEQKLDPSTGKIQTIYYVQQAGFFRKSGTYSFYAYVKYKGKNYKSNQLTVKVNDEEENDNSTVGFNSKDPIFGIIQAEKTTVYEGEPILLKAKVYSQLEIYFLEGYSPFKADKNAEEHIFENQKYEVERSKLNGKNVLTFEYGKQLLFPVGTGKCNIQPFEMALRCRGTIFDKTLSFRSSSSTINIKPLPNGAPKDFIGAVGVYTFSQELGKQKGLKEGDVFTLILTVNGLGNLHNSNAPILKLPTGCVVYGDPEREDSFSYTEDGVEGFITYRYNIQLNTGGKIHFQAPSISYFNPNSESYTTVKGKPFSLDVEPNPVAQSIVDRSTPALLHSDKGLKVIAENQGRESTWGVESPSTSLLVGVTAPIFVLGLLFLFFKRKRKDPSAGPGTSVQNNDEKNPSSLSSFPEPKSGLFSSCKTLASTDYWSQLPALVYDPNLFAIVLPKAIIQRLEQHFNTEFISREKALAVAADRNSDVAIELRKTIEVCDQFRYGFMENELDVEALLRSTTDFLNRL